MTGTDQLAGKTAIVTGASRGIGLAIVRALADAGARVVGSARTATRELADRASVVVTADLTTPDGPAELVQTALERVGDIDILVNCAGGGSPDDLRDFFGYDDEIWRKTFALNLYAAVRTCRAAIPSLIRRGGVIVNISSVGAHLPQTGPAPYGAAKAALTAYSKALAEEVARDGVRVVTITPGLTRTPMWTSADGMGAQLAAAQGITLPELLDALPGNAGSSTGRFVEPEEVGALTAFLVSAAAPSMTGQEYIIDGGAIKTV